MSLRARFTFIASLAVASSIALLAVLVYMAERREVVHVADTDLTREGALVLDSLADGSTPGAALDENLVRAYDLRGQLLETDGRITPLAGGPSLPTSEEMLAVASGDADRFVMSASVAGTDYRVLTVPSPEGALVLGRSMTDVNEHMRSFAGALLLLVAGGLGVAVLLGAAVAGAGTRPIARLTHATERLTRERMLRRRLEVHGDDELARLSASVNELLDSAEDARRSQNQLVADASHELRTPLTTVWTDLQVLEDERLPVTERERLLSEVRGEVSGLMSAVDDLLELAREEQPDLVMDELSIDTLVEEAVAVARLHWPDVDFVVATTETVRTADRAQVFRAVSNLLDNAAKWSPAGGVVEVTLRGGVISVRDHGAGVPAGELSRVFERFYRATSSRGLPGAGLGLAIVRKVVEDHGWSVRAANAPDGGAVLTIDMRAGDGKGLTSGSAAVDPVGASTRKLRALRVWGTAASAVAVTAIAVALIVTLDQNIPGANHPVPLVSLSGELTRCDGQFCVADQVVDFGPSWYVRGTTSPHDYDGDGESNLLQQELDGLLGREIRLETDGGHLDQDVYSINGMPFRDEHGQLPEPPEVAAQ